MAVAAPTPGPWRVIGQLRQVNPCGDLWCGEIELPARKKYRGSICSIQSADHIADGISADEAAANARLIAAAPDLLALLRELIDIEGPQPGTSDWANKVHAAIAKATGVA